MILFGAGPGSLPPGRPGPATRPGGSRPCTGRRGRPRLAPTGPRIRSLPAEAVEFPVPDAAEKGVPLIRCEPQDGPRGIPAVTNADLAPGRLATSTQLPLA